jgi:hypothetical protein
MMTDEEASNISVSSSFDEGLEEATRHSSDEAASKEADANVIGRRETRLVWLSRLLAFVVLVAAAVTAGYLTYKFVNGVENSDFQSNVSAFCAHCTVCWLS